MIIIKKFVVNEFQVNAFVLHDETNQAIIIDGAVKFESEINDLLNYVNNNKLEIKFIISTHGHIDHICGNKVLKDKYNVPILINSEDNFLIDSAVSHAQMYGLALDQPPKPDESIEDNSEIKFGNSRLKNLLVPGHTPGSIAFYSSEQNFVIAGDVLFSGSIGRTDLPQGNYNTLINSIKSKLMILPDDTKVYCGHGPETSIGYEKIHNPFL